MQYQFQENEETLDIVKNLFQKMGYRIHFHENMEWDILWSHTYPFYSLAKEMANLKSSQKVGILNMSKIKFVVQEII